ncbi:DUF2208 domain-containing protein [Saccharolobus solfataricus]|uniref:DUF2208 domain-containing protein n=3 Tax=Saccharolobus solfataricus TaxID=2287 RepID=Q980B2_SACS2|nr:DUF2208 family protein [Saccharolobus solfataricus]AAK40732.1 Conserved hypothetical protein [Saccharolobus solfataricus P2]AKA73709.1 DUF2208 domain-containing protein [Saccharolobus solfataricus]AKA76406.1 DUF2208 domain-containing protein [Saccharolobus solfataricus]AKA79099.1 DUF2208 domain-containing protein [Saccharolobus solfataricus]AZF68180.1 DUF2208 domain-containing protein [Saccharolobus solfataricus]
MSSTGYNPFNWKFVLLSQVMMILFSLVLSFFPKYFIEFYILYILVYLGITSVIMMRSNPLLRERRSLGEIANARTLYEEKKASELVNQDEEYLKETTEVMKKNFSSMGIMFLYMIILILVYNYVIIRFVTNIDNTLYKFGFFVLYFELLYGVSFLMNRRVLKFQTNIPMAPTSYKITEKGIIATDRSGVFLPSKYLIDAQISQNRDKKYIEIRSSSKFPFQVRLYSQDIDKVSELIERVKKIELKKQSSAES